MGVARRRASTLRSPVFFYSIFLPGEASMRWIVGLTLVSSAILSSGCNVGNGEVKSEPTASAKPDAKAPSSIQNIHIDNFTFDPKTVTITPGTKVIWTNRDDVPHTATSTAKPKAFDSGTLDTDQTFEYVFSKPGTYEYYCAVHPKMTATIIVK
jgi:plastocyanin